MSEPAGSRSITLTRTYDAPRPAVFAAWTEAHQLQKWWGPDGMEAPSVTSDPRPGGELTIEMVGHGLRQTMRAIYREVEPPERLVVDSVVPGAGEEPVIESSHTVTFVDLGGRTEVTVEATATVFGPEGLGALEGMRAGWNQSLQCLDDALSGAVDRQVVLLRVYPAPPDTVFGLWVAKEHLQKWWGPEGSSLTTEEFDPRPRGRWRFTMHDPQGTDYPAAITYNEIVPSTRLTFTHRDPTGVDPPFTTVVTFDEFGGQTALSMRHVFASPGDRHLVVAKHRAIEGGNQTLARLAALLEHLATEQGPPPR